MKHMQIFQGVNGSRLDKNRMRRQGVLKKFNMRRGQIGCYLSHKKIWEKVVHENHPHALILEDDVNLIYSSKLSRHLHAVIGSLKTNAPNWDIFYLSRRWRHSNRAVLGQGLTTPYGCQEFSGYMVSRAGAKKLLAGVMPMQRAIDVHASHLSDTGRLKAVAMAPRLCYVVPAGSDTRGIR